MPIGNIIIGTFGSLSYPMCLIFAFISLALFLGFSYKKNKKPLVLFVVALFSVFLAIHSIATYKQLDMVVTSANLKTYLNLSYNKSTLVGSFGSIFAGLLSTLLGAMGTIIVFVISATISAGLLLDYELYGKYHETHIKKIKSRKVREKVYQSDKNVNNQGVPDYSFEGNGVADEVVVDAKEYETNSSSYIQDTNYSTAEVVHEITSDQIDDSSEGLYSSLNQTYDYSNQTQNTFSNDIYQTENIPDIYSSDMDNHRREFMNATFGTTAASATEEDNLIVNEPEVNFDFSSNISSEEQPEEKEDQSTFDPFGFNTFEEDESANESSTSDDDIFSKLLNISNDDIEAEVNKDVEENSFNTPNRFEEPKPVINNDLNNRFGSNFNSYNQPKVDQFVQQASPVNNAFSYNSQNAINNQNVVVPSKEINKSKIVSKIGMFGVRYNAPTLSLLKTPVPDRGDYTAEQTRKTALLENVLSAFNIQAKVKNIVRGPKITRYELSLPLGTSVRKIPSYEDDIAAALAAKTITIKAPIPGSSYVGIELENDTFTTVYQRELLESDAFQNCKDPLPVAIGKDISGEIVVKSLVDMVHLLIAGSTGSGKSVFIHNIVLSLIFKSSPDDLRLIMIDPKKVEFPIYNGLPHLLTPEVVAGSQKAINALKWCVKEMDRRYGLMAQAGFNNIKVYNKSELVKAGQFEKLPYIVIIVDELAEVMMANKKEAEACIQRITQLARACGMHMVLATQRPSVDIITGVIKNNIPSRIAFSLQSGIDSKTILTTVGAEKLLGRGDMIFAPTGTSAWPRLQASYASDEEIKAVIDYTIKNNEANYDESVDKAMNDEQPADDGSSVSFSGGSGVPPQKDTLDAYFKEAVKMVMQNGGASTSYLQRRLSIGYSRAAKIMDQMSDRGYIAQASGSKQRKIIITPEQFREDFGEDFDSID